MLAGAVIGLILNVTGTAIAGMAVYRENRSHDASGCCPVAEALHFVGTTVLRRPARLQTVRSARAAGCATLEARPSGLAWPAADAPMRTQVEHLQKRTARLQTYVEAQRTEMVGKIKAADDVLADRISSSEDRLLEAEQSIIDLATGSFRMEVLGLLLIGLGSMVSVLPAVFDWR